MKEAQLKPPRVIKAAAMGRVITLALQIKDDILLGARVREIAEKTQQDLNEYKAKLAEIRKSQE
jgi:geranylgeranyl pyrophosphate synthase